MSAANVETLLESVLTGLPVGSPRPAPPKVSHIAASPIRTTIGPLFIMCATPVLMLALWMAATFYGGSLWELAVVGSPNFIHDFSAST